jgi:hypothetical protein
LRNTQELPKIKDVRLIALLFFLSSPAMAGFNMADFLRCMQLTETSMTPGYKTELPKTSVFIGSLDEARSPSNPYGRVDKHEFNTLIFRETVNRSGDLSLAPGDEAHTRVSIFSMDYTRSLIYDPKTSPPNCQLSEPQQVVNVVSRCTFTSGANRNPESCSRSNGKSRLAFSLSPNLSEGFCQVSRTFSPVSRNEVSSSRMNQANQTQTALRALSNRLIYLMSTLGSPGLAHNPSQIRMALYSDSSGQGPCHTAFAGENISLAPLGNQVLCAINPNDPSFCNPRSLTELNKFRSSHLLHNPKRAITTIPSAPTQNLPQNPPPTSH